MKDIVRVSVGRIQVDGANSQNNEIDGEADVSSWNDNIRRFNVGQCPTKGYRVGNENGRKR